METLEARAKTVEEAINRALQQLGLARDRVEVTVVREGRSGILGLGAEDAIVRVTPLSEPAQETASPEETAPRRETSGPDVAEAAQSVLGELLRLLGVSGSIETQVTPGSDEDEAGASSPVTLNIKGDDLGILIGRRGQTLAALQYICRLLVGRRVESWTPLVVDVEGYKQRRHEALQTLARDMAERVKARRVPFTFEPMPPYERRVIHMALVDFAGVMTESVGQGDERKVVIRPTPG